MTAEIHILVPRDGPCGDAAATEAFPALRRELFQLAREMDVAGSLVTTRDLCDLPRRLKRIGLRAGRLGLVSLADTAENAANAIRDPAFSALWARMVRLTKAALDPADAWATGAR